MTENYPLKNTKVRDDRGIALLGMLVCAGAFAGSHRGAWWTLWGALIMLGIYGPIYLVGCREKRQMIMETKTIQQNQNETNGQRPRHDEDLMSYKNPKMNEDALPITDAINNILVHYCSTLREIERLKKDAERGQALSAESGSVFELVDCTNDENYFPMGLFLSLEDALAQVKDREEPPTDDPEEFVRMEVRERQIGKLRWWDNGKTVATIQWIKDYIEAKDEWVWHTPTISLPNNQRKV